MESIAELSINTCVKPPDSVGLPSNCGFEGVMCQALANRNPPIRILEGWNFAKRRNWVCCSGLGKLSSPPLGSEELKMPLMVSHVLPSPPHTRHLSSLVSELRTRSQPTCWGGKSRGGFIIENSNYLVNGEWGRED